MNKTPLNLEKTSAETRALITAVNELMGKTGYDFPRAWLSIKKTRPDLIQAVNVATPQSEWKSASAPVVNATATESLPETRAITTAVNEMMTARRCDFSAAWTLVKQGHPELFQAAKQATDARNEKLRRENQAAFRNK